MKFTKLTVSDLTKQALIAALYAVVTIALAPIDYGPVQFRIVEMLMILPFYNKKHTIGLTLGCFLANIASPMGIWDMILGTLATFIVCIIVSNLKAKTFIGVISALVNGIIVGIELYLFLECPLLFSIFTVALGEFVVVQLGLVAFALVEKSNLISIFRNSSQA